MTRSVFHPYSKSQTNDLHTSIAVSFVASMRASSSFCPPKHSSPSLGSIKFVLIKTINQGSRLDFIEASERFMLVKHIQCCRSANLLTHAL